MNYHFRRFNFTSNIPRQKMDRNHQKIGIMIYLNIPKFKTQENLFRINTIIKGWNIEKSRIEYHGYTTSYHRSLFWM